MQVRVERMRQMPDHAPVRHGRHALPLVRGGQGRQGRKRRQRRANSRVRRPRPRPRPRPRRRIRQAFVDRYNERASCPVRGRRRGSRRRRRPAQREGALLGEKTKEISAASAGFDGQEARPSPFDRIIRIHRQETQALIHLRGPHLLPLRLWPRRVRVPRRAHISQRRRRGEPDPRPDRSRAVHAVAPRGRAVRGPGPGGVHARRDPGRGSHAEVPVRIRDRRPARHSRLGQRIRQGAQGAQPGQHPAGIHHQPREPPRAEPPRGRTRRRKRRR